MSLAIGSAANVTAPQGIARTAQILGDRHQKGPGSQTPEAADAVPKPRSLPDEPENRPMRAQPSASTDDPLRRLPESDNSDRQRQRARRGTVASATTAAGRFEPAQLNRPRCPYDPPPTRQRDLDLLA